MRAASRSGLGLGKGEHAAEAEVKAQRPAPVRACAASPVKQCMMPPPRQCSRSSASGVLPGFARVDHDGLAGLGGDLQLPLEDGALHVAGREVVVVVQADLADARPPSDARARSRRRAKVSSRGFRRVVRMHADGGVDERDSARPAGWRPPDRADRCRCRSPSCSSTPAAGRARSPARGRRRTARRPGDSANRPTSLQARSDRDVFEEAGQDGLAAFHRGRHDHAVGFDAAQLARLQIRDDHHFAVRPSARACRPRRCRPRWCAARGSPMSTFRCSSLSAPLTRSADSTRPTRRSTLTKSSIGDLRRSRAPRPRRRRLLAEQRVLFRGDRFFQRAHLRDRFLQFDAREDAGDLADLLPGLQAVPHASVSKRTSSSGSVMPSCAQIFGADSGSTGLSSAVAMRSALGGGVERRVELGLRRLIGLLAPVSRAPAARCTCPPRRSAPRRLPGPWRIRSASKCCLHRRDGLVGQRGDLRIAALGDLAAAVLVDHGQRAAGEVAEAVGEVGVVAADQRVVAEAAVLPEDDFAQQEIAQRRRRPSPGGWARRARCCRGDLLILSFSNSSQPWAKICLGSGRPAAIRNAGQKTAWKRDDLLADQVQVGGPEVLAIDRAHVADQRVEPDVEDVLAFDRQRDAPLDGGAADGEIVQPLAARRRALRCGASRAG